LSRVEFLRSLDLLHRPLSSNLGPLDEDSVETLEFALVIKNESLGGDAVLTRVFAAKVGHDLNVSEKPSHESIATYLGMSIVSLLDSGKLGPRVVGGSRRRRFYT
jgi:hypothetical protein